MFGFSRYGARNIYRTVAGIIIGAVPKSPQHQPPRYKSLEQQRTNGSDFKVN